MSTIAASRALNPLAGVAGPMSALRSRHDGAVGAVRNAVRQVGGARGAADRIRAAARDAGTALAGLRDGTNPALAPIRAVGRNSGIAAGQIAKARDSSRSSGRAAKRLADGGGAFDRLVGPLGTAIGLASPLLTTLGIGLTGGAVAMAAITVAMQANPFGGAAAIAVTVIGLLVDFALNTETGQRLVKKGFDKLREGFDWIKKKVFPVISKAREAVETGIRFVRDRIVDPVKSIGTTVRNAFAAARDGIKKALTNFTKLVRDPWNGIKAVVDPAANWIRDKIPPFFDRVKDATGDLLRGIADGIALGFQGFTGFVHAPARFVEWLIEKWEAIDFKKLFDPKSIGKKIVSFLAEGGLVSPPHGTLPGSITPLGDVAGLRAAEPDARSSRTVRRLRRVESFHEPAGATAHDIAEDLLFLARAG